MPERVTIAFPFDKGDLAKITCSSNTTKAIEPRLAALPPAEPVLALECDAEAHRGLRAGLIGIGDANSGGAGQGDFGDAESAKKFDWEILGHRVGRESAAAWVLRCCCVVARAILPPP